MRQKGCHKAQSEPQRQPPGAVRLWPRGKGTFGLGSSGQGWAQQHGDMRTQHAGSGAPFAIAPRRTTGGSACGSRAAKLVTCAEYTRFISKCRLWFLMEGCRRSFPPPITRASRGGSGCTACLATTVGRWGSTGTRRCRQDCSPNTPPPASSAARITWTVSHDAKCPVWCGPRDREAGRWSVRAQDVCFVMTSSRDGPKCKSPQPAPATRKLGVYVKKVAGEEEG